MNGFSLAFSFYFGITSKNGSTPSKTILSRESNGNVTIISLENTFTPILTRQSDGTVTVKTS